MGQIVGLKAKPKRCNLNKLSQLGTPAAGEYILVSYDNSMTANGQGNFDRYIMGDGRTAATALELKYLDDSTRPYIVEEVNKAVADIQPIEITGDVTNAPDEEDLTSENQGGTDVLKFKDKAYNSALYSGLGRTYLRKNIVTLEGTGKNVLTQVMVNTANTIYHIQYDYDLNGQTITLPAGCVLEFDGGSVKNGELNVNSGSVIGEYKDSTIYNFVLINKDYICLTWFAAPSETEYTNAMKRALVVANSTGKTIFVPNGEYIITDVTIPYPNIRIKGESREEARIKNKTYTAPCFFCDEDGLEISNLTFTAVEHQNAEPYTPSQDAPYNDNGRCAVLFRGNYCHIHGIDGEYVKAVVILGGDYLENGIYKYGNVVEDLRFNMVEWGVMAIQQANGRIANLIGVHKQFVADGYSDVGGSDHALYISGPTATITTQKQSKNLIIDNICSLQGSQGYTIAAKTLIDSDITNVISYGCPSIVTESTANITIDNIKCYNNTLGYAIEFKDAYGIFGSLTQDQYDTHINVKAQNISLYGGTKALFRLSNNVKARLSNVLIFSDEVQVSSDAQGLFSAIGASYLDVDRIVIKCSNITGNLYGILLPQSDAVCGCIKNYSINGGSNGISGGPLVTFSSCVDAVQHILAGNTQLKYLFQSNRLHIPQFAEGTDRITLTSLTETFNYLPLTISKQVLLYNALTKLEDGTFAELLIANQTQSRIALRIPDDNIAGLTVYCNRSTPYVYLKAGECLLYTIYRSGTTIYLRISDFGVRNGVFADVPYSPPVGYGYFCTNKQTAEGASDGIMIYHKGNNVWVDALGRVVS